VLKDRLVVANPKASSGPVSLGQSPWWILSLYKVLGGKPEGKRPLERPKHRWEGNIIHFMEVW
jgi:hypothetical protein